jgi:hypothetical protein
MNLKQTLTSKIAEVEAKIEAYNYTSQESEAASEVMQSILADLDNAANWSAETKRVLREATDKVGLNNDEYYLESLKETLAKDLMHCPLRYVVTDTEQLLSPSGFHPDERIFEQTTIAIHTNDLAKVPSSNVKLYAHEMK